MPPARRGRAGRSQRSGPRLAARSEEHTSELQSRVDLVCRLLLEKKKKKKNINCRRKSENNRGPDNRRKIQTEVYMRRGYDRTKGRYESEECSIRTHKLLESVTLV